MEKIKAAEAERSSGAADGSLPAAGA